ncbi:tripartite tricarboxylate transporter substrate binding protein [Achromobacter sp. Root170]|uniref:Bug family tripartite tricarboxylate transporter substrate binding protein n=1 Tax=Achromobacter sp. Root170 TaxID=1736480 RepID=UPI0006F96CF1|nr:tripartite tricarboxylate transporter substrate binding protein [Achromobacter sp. Root170]KRB11998.1 hypothetical protein ASD87_12350 [Achromobacter sp. Root170]
MKILSTFIFLASTAILIWGNPAAAADTYPSRPIRLVVPFPAGGGTDTLARELARELDRQWHQRVVVENRPGAGGSIGAVSVANAEPDGYTMLMTTAGVSAINPGLYKSLNYDPQAQFTPVSRVASTVFGVLVHPSLPVDSIEELVALARSKPGSLTFGSAGNGAAGHLPAELFRSMADVDIRHVPYRGTTPALNDLLGGQISMMFAILGPAAPYVQAGKVKLLATTGATRSRSFPDVPTVAEAGLPGYVADEWWGVAAPKATPPEIVQKWNAAMRSYVTRPEVQRKLVESGYEPAADSVEDFAALITADKAKWSKVIQEASVRVD